MKHFISAASQFAAARILPIHQRPHNLPQAFWHAANGGKGGYYNAEGKSLRKAFLRSPLEFSRV